MSPTHRVAGLVRIVPVVAALCSSAALHAMPSEAPAAGQGTGAKRPEPAGEPARVRVTSPSEPGTPLVLRVRVEDAATRRPVAGARLFVYQTDAAGYYDRGEDGRERGPQRSRLRATGHSDSLGSIVLDTVVPGSYPGGGVFRHIHYALSAAGYDPVNREIILDEDPRPTEEQKRWAERNGDTVARRVEGEGGRSEIRVTLRLQPAKEG